MTHDLTDKEAEVLAAFADFATATGDLGLECRELVHRGLMKMQLLMTKTDGGRRLEVAYARNAAGMRALQRHRRLARGVAHG
jgi:hypothetical protein